MKPIDYTFTKDVFNNWYIELEEWPGCRADLQMVQGADTMLDLVSQNTNEVTLMLSEEPFADAYTMNLIEVCPPNFGGGIYLLEVYDGEEINQKLWLCTVTEWLFKRLPPVIYFTVKEPTKRRLFSSYLNYASRIRTVLAAYFYLLFRPLPLYCGVAVMLNTALSLSASNNKNCGF